MRGILIAGLVSLSIAAGAAFRTAAPAAQTAPLTFSINLPAAQANAPLDGRLLLMIAKDAKAGEPRFQINDGPTGQLIFGIDVDGWKPGARAVIDGAALGFPLERISDIPAGTYSVQALLHKYETFKRADGHTVKLPMDRGEGQQWARAPGKSVQHTADDRDRSQTRGHHRDHPRPGHRAAADAERYQVRQA